MNHQAHNGAILSNGYKSANRFKDELEPEEIFGTREEQLRRLMVSKLENNSLCVIHGIKCYPNRDEWNLDRLLESDPRLKLLAANLTIKHALALQRFCWPKMDKPSYPVVCIAPKATGKTYAHLLFMVTRSILAVPRTTTDQLMAANGDSQITSISTTTDQQTNNNNNNQSQTEVDQKNFDFNSMMENQQTNNNQSQPEIDQENFDFNSMMETDQAASSDVPEIDPEMYIKHPKYIIICSSQQNVNKLNNSISCIKAAAFGHRVMESKIHLMPPNAKKLELGMSDEKLALRCNEADIVIGTPAAIVKCLKAELLELHKCRQVVFDDLDVNLQLHNACLREFAKFYLTQRDEERAELQVFTFTRKWNYLVRQFVSILFKNVTLIFASIAEAALYLNLQYELEFCRNSISETSFKLATINKLASQHRANNRNKPANEPPETMMIVCKEFTEAETVVSHLRGRSFQVYLLNEQNMLPSQVHELKQNHFRLTARPIYVTCDEKLEFLVDYFNDMTHLVHWSMPDDMLIFDQRFRAMYKLIKDKDIKPKLLTTVLVSPRMPVKQARELYDMVSRSESTLRSTKVELRDFINEHATNICWRWATTGLCKLGNQTKGDKLGTFCLDKHPLLKSFRAGGNKTTERKVWPLEGDQCKIRISHFKSPNEFYFHFDAYRNIENINWVQLVRGGEKFRSKLNQSLNSYKNTPVNSIKLNMFKRNRVYGIYRRDSTEVVRIQLLEDPVKTLRNFDELNKPETKLFHTQLKQLYEHEYYKQYEVCAIDYGYKFHAYLRNIFELSDELRLIEPQCNRAFLLGSIPPNNEPDWTSKCKKFFREFVEGNSVVEITAWLRQREFGCFWFDNLRVKQKLTNVYNETTRNPFEDPVTRLIKEGLAEQGKTPSWLQPSNRLRTISKWRVDEIKKIVRYAFLRSERTIENLYVLHILGNLDLKVRLSDFNQQLMSLEKSMLEDYNRGKLTQLNYFEEGTFCLAKIVEEKSTNPFTSINRCKLLRVLEEQAQSELETSPVRYQVECLDHGDHFPVLKSDLYLPAVKHITILPFQSINAKLADLNLELLKMGSEDVDKIRELFYNLTRDSQDNLIVMRAVVKKDKELHLYKHLSDYIYEPLVKILERDYKVKICSCPAAQLRENFEIEPELPNFDDGVQLMIIRMLRNIAEEELSSAKMATEQTAC